MGISFTFAVADGPVPQIGVPCDCRSKMSCSCEDFDYYGLCDHTGDGICEHNRLDVNLSCTNGQRVLDDLGVLFDYVGTVPVEDFLDRLLHHPEIHRQADLLRLAVEAKSKRLDIGWS